MTQLSDVEGELLRVKAELSEVKKKQELTDETVGSFGSDVKRI